MSHQTKVPLPSSLEGSIEEYGRSGQDSHGEQSKVKVGTSMDSDKPLLVKEDASGDLSSYCKYCNSCEVETISLLTMSVWVAFTMLATC